MSQPEWEELDTTVSHDPAEHGGGIVYVDKTGVYDPELEMIEPPEDLDDPRARWEIYRVPLEKGVPDWGKLDDVAKTTDQDPDELRAAFESDDPMERTYAYESWAGHYGWHEFDQYPLTLTRLEVEKRYDTDLGGKSAIENALEEEVQRLADSDAATAWSTPSDQILADLSEQGYDPESVVVTAGFGDAGWAINGDVLIDKGWEQTLGFQSVGKHPRVWEHRHVRQLEQWLEKNGYELTDKGGNVPTTEEHVYADHVIDAVTERLNVPREAVVEIAREKYGKFGQEIPWGTDGETGVWAKKVAGAAANEYQVIVGNIGSVYDGDDEEEAQKTFREYIEQSKSDIGRASGEPVTLFLNGEPIEEYEGDGGEVDEPRRRPSVSRSRNAPRRR